MAQTQKIRIKCILRKLGVPPHILGYTYATEAVNYMVSTTKESLLINDVYSHVASVYTTSQACVEASIRNAVKKALKCQAPLFDKLFKNKKTVGNHIFLTTLRDVVEEKNLEYIARKQNSVWSA